ncbi:LOW QUALITY PROTEIN: uncharacterized protein C3orf86 homolog [Piliocolobus tephrosceles]|uniref:LOW QUALITY PROTEIN: uncharacterized protein C3orf86 homolog n=1 Tax=Piliocolobus tephrosceles TaxID=591936 RepID=UPI000C2B18DD|nr:LOW QUALITY PROTEIN: uncharacterized protein C3orf86 homolog [Piliocolobus tephrosceles]
MPVIPTLWEAEVRQQQRVSLDSVPVWEHQMGLWDREEPPPQPHIQTGVHIAGSTEKQEMVQEDLTWMQGMSRSQFGQGQKPLDMFFWVNEISGEITYPPQKADAPAVSPGSPQEKPPSRPRSMQGAPCSPQGPPAQRPASAPPSKASLKDSGSGNLRPSAPTWARPKPEE